MSILGLGAWPGPRIYVFAELFAPKPRRDGVQPRFGSLAWAENSMFFPNFLHQNLGWTVSTLGLGAWLGPRIYVFAKLLAPNPRMDGVHPRFGSLA